MGMRMTNEKQIQWLNCIIRYLSFNGNRGQLMKAHGGLHYDENGVEYTLNVGEWMLRELLHGTQCNRIHCSMQMCVHIGFNRRAHRIRTRRWDVVLINCESSLLKKTTHWDKAACSLFTQCRDERTSRHTVWKPLQIHHFVVYLCSSNATANENDFCENEFQSDSLLPFSFLHKIRKARNHHLFIRMRIQ